MMSLFSNKKSRRRGYTLIEIFVAISVLSVILTLSGSLIVTHRRLLKSQRDYRVALDELSNQLDRLTTLPPADLPKDIAELKASAFTLERLPEARLSASLTKLEGAERLTLEIQWQQSQAQSAPVRLSAWLPAREVKR